MSSSSGPNLLISPVPALGYGGLFGVDSLLSCARSCPLPVPFAFPFDVVFVEACGGSVGGAEEAWVKVGAGGKEVVNIGEGVILEGLALGAILRIKFMVALGLDSAREKRPAVDVAEGGNGCVMLFVVGRDVFCDWRGWSGGGLAGNIGISG